MAACVVTCKGMMHHVKKPVGHGATWAVAGGEKVIGFGLGRR